MVILHIGADHTNSSQIILKLLRYEISCNNLQHKKFEVNLVVSVVLIIHVENRGKARVISLIGTGHTNNSQIILKFLRYDIFAVICSTIIS